MKKNLKNKLILFIIIIFIIIAIVVAIKFIFMKNLDKESQNNVSSQSENTTYSLIDMNKTENVEIKENEKVNISEALNKSRLFQNMRITEIKLVAKDGITTFTAYVKNIGIQDWEGNNIKITFKNQDGTEYGVLETYLPSINVGETNRIDASTTSDLSNAYDFSIEILE